MTTTSAQSSSNTILQVSTDSTCPICYENHRGTRIFSFPTCLHTYCIFCLQEYLETQIFSGQFLEISCPCPGCSYKLTHSDIYLLVSKRSFDAYERFLKDTKLRSNPKARWCPRCSEGQICDQEIVTCCACKTKFCFGCSDFRHRGLSCAKNKERKGKDEIGLWAKQNGAQKCPSCAILIEKNDGCNHMTCTACRHQFCWVCLKKYTSSHFVEGLCQGLQHVQEPEEQQRIQQQNSKARRGPKAVLKKVAKGVGYGLAGVCFVAVGIPLMAAGAVPFLVGYGGMKLFKKCKENPDDVYILITN